MKTELKRTQEWGIKVGLTGQEGRGRPHKQALKILEEVGEVIEAHAEWQLTSDDIDPLKKEVGDVIVTLQLFCDMLALDIEECLMMANDKIAFRTGTLKNGLFVKD